MRDAILSELADLWEMRAVTDKSPHPGRREALRECADTLRMMMAAGAPIPPAPPKDCPHAAPFRYCAQCVANPCPIALPRAPAPKEQP